MVCSEPGMLQDQGFVCLHLGTFCSVDLKKKKAFYATIEKSLFTHMMWNILVYLSMPKGRFSIAWQSCGLQQDLLCSNQIKPVERSEKIIPPPPAWCAQGSWPWSCSHPNNSCWFWADSVWELGFVTSTLPTDSMCSQQIFLCFFHSTNSGAVPLLLVLILELSHPPRSSPLLPSPHTLHRAPCALPKPLQGSHTGFGWVCKLFMLNIAGFG